ncbi:MAG: hypothetical protein QNK37_14390 [Acidobacteriota bacterium]|nr:hypothetical protein [Acidobacteriota bacterium]
MSVIKMLKVTVLTHEHDIESVMEGLQEAGVLHISPLKEMSGAASRHGGTGDAVDQCEQLERLVHALGSVAPAPVSQQVDDHPVRKVIELVEDLVNRRKDLVRREDTLGRQIQELKPWGAFDPKAVDELRRSNVPVTFAILTREQWSLVHKDAWAFGVMRETDEASWVVFFGAEPPELPVTPVELPDKPLPELKEEREELRAQIAELNREIGRFAHFAPLLRGRMDSLKDRVALLEALDSTAVDTPLVALRGYVPVRESLDLQRSLRPYKVLMRLEEVEPDDSDVPVMLKNNWLVAGFEAVLQTFSGINYREKDVTWAVGLLFIIFGSLCLVDAGYGIMLLATGIALAFRGQKDFGRVFLFTGLVTIPLGLLSGQAFGLIQGRDFSLGTEPILPLANDPLSAFNFSLVVGGIAMTFSYMIAIWQRGFKTHATGNLLLVLAVGCAAVSALVLPEDQAGVGKLTAGVLGSLALIGWLLFPEPVFGGARVPNIIWTLYSGVTGLIQDILSHMRLFGIALSGSILATVVNQIGMQFPLLVTIPFAVVGHIFVYALALLSLYIHTNRLIFLEVGSKCIDGGHLYYQPLRRGASS